MPPLMKPGMHSPDYLAAPLFSGEQAKPTHDDPVVVVMTPEQLADVEADPMWQKAKPTLKGTEMETFVQPKITGYRQLNEAEAALMNEIKARGVELGELVQKLRGTDGLDQRWVSIGATDLQTGLMALTRSVAQPTTF